ncbi:DUF2470 domain-containing protein [Kitasatospora sp. NBC_01287]|uniref:DUF2470 domain-containing protein n=1 Tax=Kitasatospora sp. NBC_01287 TaxID=2903573 RepID=UPI00225B5827|nr:DUF2470 domain-containing protein [Kitasatospora sp. NBC_01287]MCX4750373.1 DUF2470 domain-containing protein [Kitasatospora sp. NBC_01287]
MAATHTRTTGADAAERVRTVLAAADSLALATERHSYDLIGVHALDPDGGLTMRVPRDTPLAAEHAQAPRGALACVVEITDVAPAAVRDRVRARVTLVGRLLADERASDAADLTLRLDLAHATLRTVEGGSTVAPEAFTAARPDPLARCEAHLLTHLTDDHQDVLALLAGLVGTGAGIGAGAPPGPARAWPLALDRHGLTLRLEHPHTRRDVRLLFPTPARTADQAGDRVRALLDAAHPCRHHHHHHGDQNGPDASAGSGSSGPAGRP